MQLVASCIFKHFQPAALLEKSTDYKSSQYETHTVVVSYTAQAALTLAAVFSLQHKTTVQKDITQQVGSL